MTMNVISKIVRNKWFIGIVGLLLFSLLVWFGLGFIRFGESNTVVSGFVRSIIIGMAWLTWFTWNISQLWVSKYQNSKFLSELSAETEDGSQATPANVHTEEELKNMSKRFRSAVDVLKSTRFSSSKGRVNLYELPWYVIIGPPGAGKTTALVNSGLDFPLAGSHGKQSLGGVGGTRHCDWWFTNDAVLIDTAGRYTTQDSHASVDSSAWGAFLQLLRKYRRRRPINGVIVAVSIQDIILGSEEKREEYARKIRSRIDELQKQLEVHFPIYFVFTKMDLIAGFNEYFSTYSQPEREQVWGVTFEDTLTGQSFSEEKFKIEFLHLVKKLNDRVLSQIHSEKNIDKRSSIQNFPSQFESLENDISNFVRQCFSGHRFNLPPLLRGVYFTSATQEGSPIDRMTAKLSRDFNLENKQKSVLSLGAGKSFFINRLFKDVIFEEAELVGVNKKVEAMLAWSRRAAFVALIGIFVLSLSVWIGGVAQNKILISKVASSYNTYKVAQKSLAGSSGAVSMKEALQLLDPLLKGTRVYDEKKNSLLSWLGLYDSRVSKTIQSVYEAELNNTLLVAYANMVEQQLNGLSERDDELFSTLKVYLMIFDKEHRDYQFLQNYTVERLAGMYKNDQQSQDKLLEHFQNLTRIGFIEPQNANEELIASVRSKLYQIPLAQRVYAQLKQEGDNPKLVNLYHEIGGNTLQLFGVSERDPLFNMPYLFTKQGFNKTKLDTNSSFMQGIKNEYWVYGDEYKSKVDKTDLVKLSTDVEQLYLLEYADKWSHFYTSFNLEAFPRGGMMIARLKRLADPVSSPLLKITDLVVKHTQLNKSSSLVKSVAGDKGLIAGAADKLVTKNLVDKQFSKTHQITEALNEQPAKIQDYLIAVSELVEFLTEIEAASDSNQAAYDIARARFTGEDENPIQNLGMLSESAPDQFKVWLKSIAQYSWADVLTMSKQHLDDKWRRQVYDAYRQDISGRYPALASARTEINVGSFNEFFKKNGVYHAFFEDYLSPFVDTRNWKLKVYDGNTLGISQNTLSQLNRADMLRKAYYSSGDELTIDFRVKAEKLSSNARLFSLETGEHRFSYSHGPRLEKPITWVAGVSGRTRFFFEGLNGNIVNSQYAGNWSLLRFYDNSGKANTVNTLTKSLEISKDGYSTKINLYSNVKINPFNFGLIRNFYVEAML